MLSDTLLIISAFMVLAGLLAPPRRWSRLLVWSGLLLFFGLLFCSPDSWTDLQEGYEKGMRQAGKGG